MRRYLTQILLITTALFDLFLLFYPPHHTLDARLFYTPTAAISYLDSLGETGRRHYWFHELVDLSFIFVYSAITVKLMHDVSRRAQDAFSGRLVLVCLLAGFFDFFETAGILVLLASYPKRYTLLATVVAISTPLKWGSFLLVLSIYLLKCGRASRLSARSRSDLSSSIIQQSR